MDYTKKQPSEKFFIEIDFSGGMNDDETISLSESVIKVEDDSGADVTGDLIVTADTNVSGNSLFIRIQGGESGNNYKLTAKIKTSEQNELEKDVRIKVFDS